MKRILLKFIGKTGYRALLSLSLRSLVYCVYFGFSFSMLFIGDETPLWAVALVVINFANAARLVRKVDLQIEEE